MWITLLDHSDTVQFHDSLILERGGERFLLIYNPRDAPIEWEGWVIHGHIGAGVEEDILVEGFVVSSPWARSAGRGL